MAPRSSTSTHMMKRNGEMTQPIMLPTSSAYQLVSVMLGSEVHEG